MKRIPISALLAVLASAAALAQPASNPIEKPAEPFKPDGLIVHEWGTFTSFSGPSGDLKSFNIALGEGLPDFVQARITGENWLPVRNTDFEKLSIAAQQRMETPVLYFYSDKPTDLSVSVQMPRGLITEVYPPVSGALPVTLQSVRIPPAGSSVRWDHVTTTPHSCCDSLTLPTGGDSHYFEARATQADTLRVEQDDKAFSERFLFYRGIANGDLGLQVKALGDDRFQVERSAAGLLATVFAVEVAGKQVRFTLARDVKPGDQLRLPKESTTSDSLGSAMAESLLKAGLYQDEALAMVKTWQHLWFGESGTRVMVILPQSTIDDSLPLTITPTPKEIKRVFVARLEMLTPERQQWIEEKLARLDAASDAEKDAISAELSTLGRFYSPAISIAREAKAHEAAKRPATSPN